MLSSLLPSSTVCSFLVSRVLTIRASFSINILWLAPPVTGGPNMGALPPPEAYAVSPEEKTKYDSLFATYDKDKTRCAVCLPAAL